MLARTLTLLKEHWLLLLVSAASLAFAVGFAYVGSEVLEGDNRRVDVAVREWFQAHQDRRVHALFSAITRLGARIVLIPLAVVVGWPLFRGHYWWLALLLFCGLASAELVSVLKSGFSIPRPPMGMVERESSAFPSGHVTAAATVAAVLGYLALRRRIAPFWYISGGGAFVLLVALSRLYLDMHWFSDVAGGVLIGSTFATGCCALFEWVSIGVARVQRRRSGGDTGFR